MKKRISIVILSLLLLLSMTATAFAAVLEPDRACSLTLTMEYDGEKLNSGALTIYRVAEVSSSGGWHFLLVSDLQDSGISLEDLSASGLADSLWTKVQEKELAGTVGNIRQGKVSFSGLSCGLYLVTQTERQASAEFEPILPFLISLPQQENGAYIYEVTAQPKVGLEPEPTVPSTTRPGGDLPQTGQLNWPVPVMAAGGLALFALGWYLFFGKRDGYEA